MRTALQSGRLFCLVGNEIPEDGEMISVNHSCGLLGVDCGNTPPADRPLCTRAYNVCTYVFAYMRVPVILFSHKLRPEGTVVLGWADRRSRSRIELANRICMEQVVTIPGHDSSGPGDRISRPHFRSSRLRRIFPPRDVSCFPVGTRGGIAESSAHACMHTHVQLPQSSTTVLSELFHRR